MEKENGISMIDISENKIVDEDFTKEENEVKYYDDNLGWDDSSLNYLLELDEFGSIPNMTIGQHLRIPKNSNLRIKLFNRGNMSKNIYLLTNAYDPSLDILNYIPDHIDTIKLPHKRPPTEVDSFIKFNIVLNFSGPIFFLFSFYDKIKFQQIFTKKIFIIVEPNLNISNNIIGLDSIQLQTILSKSLGKLDNWEKYYEEAKSLNYNFVHFTPIQKLGNSESLYCIADHIEINDIFFDELNLENDMKLKMIDNSISCLREKYAIGSMVDIVLNHAASNSEWLLKYPESGYNLDNFPHLNCAYELDKFLLNYSRRFADIKVPCKSAPYINNENDLYEIIADLRIEVYRQNFEEFFLIPIEKYMEEFRSAYATYKKDFKEYLFKKNYLLEKLKADEGIILINESQIYDLIFECCLNYGASRFGVIINVEFISILTLYNLNNEIPSEIDFIKYVNSFINRVNDFWNKKAKEFLDKAIENIRAYIKYEFLDLKRFKVTQNKRLVDNYFIELDENDKKGIFACNGWLFGENDPTINFALYGNWHYFNRSIVIWGDCAKLNYGNHPNDSPYLWERMTKYVQDMAKIFNGFRLDNAHSTPIHVGEYLMLQARKVNPSLFIIAELFAGNMEREISFVNRIGINNLIRESIYCNDASKLSEKIHQYGGGFEFPLGKLDEKIIEYVMTRNKVCAISFNPLRPNKPRSIIYDITHDNPTYYEKFHNLGLSLSFLTTISMAQCSIGTTRGVDQLFPYQPSVVKENRNYLYDEPFVTSLNSKNNTEIEYTFDFNLNNFPDIKASTVKLALSSNDWKPNISLKKINGAFSITLKLPVGIYYYKYVIDDNKWIFDHTKPNIKEISGITNNVLDLFSENKIDNLKDLKIIRRYMNSVRNDLISKQSSQNFVHRDRDLICIFRMFTDFTEDYNGYALICRTGYEVEKNIPIKSKIELPGKISKLIFFSRLFVPKFDINVIRSDSHLLGIPSNLIFRCDIKELNSISNITYKSENDVIDFHSLAPNTVILLKLKHPSKVQNSIMNIERSLKFLSSEGEQLIEDFDLCDINHALYKCEKEELDFTKNKRGNYEIKNYGKFVYAGLTHLHKLIQEIKKTVVLDHALLNNIREGDWLMNFKINRLKESSSLSIVYAYLNQNIMKYYSDIPIYNKPYYLCKTIDSIMNLLTKRVLTEVFSNSKVLSLKMFNNSFFQNLILSAFQFTGNVESSKFQTDPLSLSAGLPHFSTGYMRCWGRDTFISFKGLLLITGFHQQAKQIIKNFASTLRHGLIPNLLDCGNQPRYNSRDSVWFFLNAIRDYINFSNDYKFLDEEIKMLFLDDDMNVHLTKVSSNEKKFLKISEIIYKILESHCKGIEFREWRAGKLIDEHMKDEGFNIKIYLDINTGFIYGGNSSNCGTWMDKMGSSEKSKSKGIPATPRDGADVEIIGILYSILIFVVSLNNIHPNLFPYKSIKISQDKSFSFYEWSLLIKDNFESNFFVNSSPYSNTKKYIYKDYISHSYIYNTKANYQLRPNFLVSMAISPELFTKENALRSLELVEKYLLVPEGLGVRTLDYEDAFYNGNYENSDNSDNFFTAHGFNYHNGPEWLWPIGYYIISKINFHQFDNQYDLESYIISILNPHNKYILSDNWKGLPELMNKNNSFCQGSCNTQAWSIATILESLYEFYKNNPSLA